MGINLRFDGFFGNRSTSHRDINEIIDDFKNGSWKELSSSEKIDFLQEFADAYAESIGLDNPPRVKREHDPNVYGVHYHSKNLVKINLTNCSNPYKAMDTVVHEVNHAYQHQCVEKDEGYSNEERALIKAQIGPAYCDKGPGYHAQTVELDSNNVAAEFVMEHCDDCIDDEDYYEYINNRNERFENVNDILEERTGFCNGLETDQVYIANAYGCTSEDERSEALLYIGKHSRAREESIEIGDKVKETYYECSLEHSKVLHNKFDDFEYNNRINGRVAFNLKYENDKCIEAMAAGKVLVDEKINELQAEKTEYVTSNSMDYTALQNDEYAKQLNEQLAELEKQSGNYKAHIAQLEGNNRLIDERMGWVPQVEVEDTNNIERHTDEKYVDIESVDNGEALQNNPYEEKQEIIHKDDGLGEEVESAIENVGESIQLYDGLGDEPENTMANVQENVRDSIQLDDGLGDELEKTMANIQENVRESIQLDDGLGDEPENTMVNVQGNVRESIQLDDGLGEEPETAKGNAQENNIESILKDDGLGDEQLTTKENTEETSRVNDVKMDNDNSM